MRQANTAMVNKRTFDSRVRKCFSKWKQDFLSVTKSGAIYSYANENKPFIDEQIQFMGGYIGFMAINGRTQWNLDRITRFLSMQTAIDDPARIELRFIGGSPIDALAFVETLNDIDLADVYSLTRFEIIYAYKSGRKRWTEKSIIRFLDEIEEDISYDGTRISLRCSMLHSRGIVIERKIE